MKKVLYFFLLSFLVYNYLSAQINKPVTGNQITYITNTKFEITKPFRELALEHPAVKENEKQRKEVDKQRPAPQKLNPNSLPLGEDGNVQRSNGNKPLQAPLVNFTALTGMYDPPDPTGAAGVNYIVEAVNTSFRVYNKSGTPLMNEMDLATLWTGTSDAGDPVVLYDKYADRWFLSELEGNGVVIAVSVTNDPTGSYYKYTFVPTNASSIDYPKYSIWPDGYYMTANYGTENVAVFNRTQMLAGNPSAGMITATFNNLPSSGFFSPLPADADGQLPPLGTPCYMFCFEDDGWGAPATTDQIHIYKMHVDWTTPANTTFIEDVAGGSPLHTLPFNSVFTQTWDDISQPGTSQHVDAISGVFTFRSQFRQWTGYNTALMCNAVNLNPSTNRAGVRWYELRQNTNTNMWSIYQQNTFAPDSNNRWIGSMAMDDNGNIGLAYCISGTSTFPGMAYTGRCANDPLNQMTFAEQTAITGTASKTGGNRYGDYSQTSLDPDGITFWHVGEWQSGGNQTQFFSFQLSCATTGIAENENRPGFIAAQMDNALVVKGDKLPDNENVVVDLFEISGKQILHFTIIPSGNNFETKMDISNFAHGSYLVRIGNLNFQKVIKVILN